MLFRLQGLWRTVAVQWPAVDTQELLMGGTLLIRIEIATFK